MSQNKPSFDEFKMNIEKLFGQRLTEPASQAADDFWRNWSAFSALIANRSLAVHVDAFRLTHNFPEYRRYQVWKGAGIVAFLVGIVFLWFYWQIGVALIALGIGLHFWGGRMKFNAARSFAEELMKNATLNPSAGGYARICTNYIAGIIQLDSPVGSAHWPQFPSNVISGERSFIQT